MLCPWRSAWRFVPVAWQTQPTLALAQIAGGRVVPVLQSTDLQVITGQSGSTTQQAAAYGLVLSLGAPVASAGSLPAVTPHQVQHSAQTKVRLGTTYDLGRFVNYCLPK